MKKISSSFSMSAIFIIAMFTSPPCSAARKLLSSETDTAFIKTWCDSTSYPDLCFATFSSYAAEIKGSPQILATKSLFVALNTTRSASKSFNKLRKKQGLKTREAAALQDCVEEISDSFDEIKRSVAEMGESGGKSFAFRMSDVQTWASAALTDENTCMDGFSETAVDGAVKDKVRTVIEKVAHLTSISLSIVNRYAGAKN
ncbi:putative Plant invertase/pectin methylesterase inhibitor superfamily protein [Hibiscus syriacus]|uniref:Plant invertase/pectin methylesterase inhibitor superfamily protein n=1 Tax=Hibiscus syriacus TaxID=106335 RepID=A0A6A3CG15_HIBSY|nr:21 kDa protein-like [Hibiscus syriacus]XP_039056327.1 21 kDa protein-like [Hibiscus syriacus]KAE8727706.1 putative Plant invertase/pectin methylesterase inhibitor superfamily protein [Hibiscus syriacus]